MLLASIINSGYDDYEDDDNHSIRVTESFLFVMVSNTSSSGVALSTELLGHDVDCTTITDDATPGDAVQKGDENVVSPMDPFYLASDTSNSSDAPFPKLNHNETTPIS